MSLGDKTSLRWNGILASGIVRLLVFFPLAVLTVFSQTQTKTVEWAKYPLSSHGVRTTPNIRALDQIDEIEIEDVLFDGKPITIGQPFMANDDWLRDISFRVKNVSSQKLLKIQLDMIPPELDKGVQVVYCYGCAPTEKEKGVIPGEEVELKMPGGNMYGWVRDRIIENGSISRITRAQIRVVTVSLPDGSRWTSGCVKTADPKNACPSPSP